VDPNVYVENALEYKYHDTCSAAIPDGFTYPELSDYTYFSDGGTTFNASQIVFYHVVVRLDSFFSDKYVSPLVRPSFTFTQASWYVTIEKIDLWESDPHKLCTHYPPGTINSFISNLARIQGRHDRRGRHTTLSWYGHSARHPQGADVDETHTILFKSTAGRITFHAIQTIPRHPAERPL
jgi:hypothetical protein